MFPFLSVRLHFGIGEKKKQKGVEQKRVADERVRKFFVGK